jgi:hypothetical protein
LVEQYGNTSAKDNDMEPNESRYSSETAIELMLLRGTSGSAFASLELALHRRADWFGAMLLALSMCQLWMIGQGSVLRYFYGAFATLLIVLAGCFLLDRFMIVRQSASPAYIEAALRCLEAEGRVTLLERINKALRRHEFRPISKSDVVEMLKLTERSHSTRLVKCQKHERQTAQLQAAFIDLFREA